MKVLKLYSEKIGGPIIRQLPLFIVTFFSLLLTMKFGIVNNQNLAAAGGGEVYSGIQGGIIGIIERLCIVGVLSYLLTFIVDKCNKLYAKYIAYCVVFVIALFDLFLLYNFNAHPGAEVFRLIAESNSHETSDFFKIYLFSTNSLYAYLRVFIYILIAIALEHVYSRVRHRNVHKSIWVLSSVVGTVLILVGIYESCVMVKMFNLDEGVEEINTYAQKHKFLDPITKSFVGFKVLSSAKGEVEKAINKNKSIINGPAITCNDTLPLNIVVVIGESHIRSHSSIYGYSLNTNPYLSKEQETGHLAVFKDVLSQYSQTSLSVKNILSCNNLSQGESWCEYPLFMTIFRKAGFKVYMWDNQRSLFPNSNLTFALNSFLYAESIKDVAYDKINSSCSQYDADFIKTFDVDISKGRNLVIFHLNGQHFDAKSRYPKEFQYFTIDSIKRKDSYLTKKKKNKIAEYDNATRYNDYVLSEIINKIEKTSSILFYFSDHGEEVYDYRDHYGRVLGNVVDENLVNAIYRVPFVVWLSDRYKEQYPEETAKIFKATERHFGLDRLSNTLFRLGRIETDYYNCHNDVIDNSFIQSKRVIYAGEKKYFIE